MTLACTSSTSNNTKCFFVYDTPKTNAQAQQACRDNGLELAYFMNADEYNTFKVARDELGIYGKTVWINGYRKDGSSSHDKNGFEYHILEDDGNEKIIDLFSTPSVYKSWNPGEPNSIYEKCVEARWSNDWNDFRCNEVKPYACVGLQMVNMKKACTADNTKCFFAYDTPKTNAQAQQACRDNGMELAYFMNSDEYNTFKTARYKLGIFDDGMWINGYRKGGSSSHDKNGFEYHILEDDGNEKFIDFSTPGVYYKNWHSGEPNSGYDECLQIKEGDSYEWNDIACGETMPYACVQNFNMKKACTTDNSICFFVYDNSKTNAQAQQACRHNGLELAYFMNADEYNTFKAARDELGNFVEAMWINGYRKDGSSSHDKNGFEYHILEDDGNEKIIDFSTPGVYKNWSYGEPNYRDEGCVEVFAGSSYKWNDAKCGLNLPYACSDIRQTAGVTTGGGESAPQEQRVCKN